jgi:hypothetical protein
MSALVKNTEAFFSISLWGEWGESLFPRINSHIYKTNREIKKETPQKIK